MEGSIGRLGHTLSQTIHLQNNIILSVVCVLFESVLTISYAMLCSFLCMRSERWRWLWSMPPMPHRCLCDAFARLMSCILLPKRCCIALKLSYFSTPLLSYRMRYIFTIFFVRHCPLISPLCVKKFVLFAFLFISYFIICWHIRESTFSISKMNYRINFENCSSSPTRAGHQGKRLISLSIIFW